LLTIIDAPGHTLIVFAYYPAPPPGQVISLASLGLTAYAVLHQRGRGDLSYIFLAISMLIFDLLIISLAGWMVWRMKHIDVYYADWCVCILRRFSGVAIGQKQ
jgi:hypothetical protein